MLAGAKPKRRASEPGTHRRDETPPRRRIDGPPDERLSVERPLASSEYTDVWLAAGPGGRRAALKCLNARALESPGGAQRIVHEAKTLAQVRHAAIVDLIGVRAAAGIAGLEPLGDSPVLVLEYLGGGDLTSLTGLPCRHWAPALADLVAAVQYLHAGGIVHGDIKARNVMFDARGRARLIDFSCAARTGVVFSKPFGTPEHRRVQASNHVVSTDDDCYALAVLVHELMTGRLPDARARRSASAMRGPAAERALMDIVWNTLDAQSTAPPSGLHEMKRAVTELGAEHLREGH